MIGVVKTRHLMSYARVIVHEFGVRCYLRCVWRTISGHRPVTFLECATAFRQPRLPSTAKRNGNPRAPMRLTLSEKCPAHPT
jgi:hypothetical protein